MKNIKAIEDCSNIVNDLHRNLLTAFITALINDTQYVYDPESQGHIQYVEDVEDCRHKDLLDNVAWEGTAFFIKENIYEIILYNNEYVMSYFIPKEHVGIKLQFLLNEDEFNGSLMKYDNTESRLNVNN